MKKLLKWLLFPGLDLHTRCRYRWLPPLFIPGPIETLDVGFGNGAFSFAAARKGNRVTSVSMDQGQVDKARAFFGSGSGKINFVCLNAYKLQDLGKNFDQIICLEALEHMSDDKRIIRLFSDILRPGGLFSCAALTRSTQSTTWEGRTVQRMVGMCVMDTLWSPIARCSNRSALLLKSI